MLTPVSERRIIFYGNINLKYYIYYYIILFYIDNYILKFVLYFEKIVKD